MNSLSADLRALLTRIEDLEKERDQAFARAERAEFENGELLDQLAEFKTTMTAAADVAATEGE